MKFGLRFFMSASSCVAALAVVPPMVSAKMVDHDISGNARTRFHWEDNAGLTDTDAKEEWQNSVKLNLDIMPAAGLKIRLAPQFNNVWGDNTNTVDSFTAKEAWMSYAPNNMVNMMLGRQYMAFGSETFFGANKAAMFGSFVHDALNVSFAHDMGTANLFLIKNDENSYAGGKDADIFGLFASFDKVNGLKTVDLLAAWWDDRNNADADGKNRFGTFGVRGAAEMDAIDVDAELLAQFGKRSAGAAYNDVKGVSGDLNVGYGLAGGHRVGALFAYANTEFSAPFASTTRQTQHSRRYMGEAAVLTRNNVIAMALVSNWALSKEFEASLDGYYFMSAKDDAGSAGGKATAAKRGLGMEGDMWISYMPMEMITFDLGYALFKPMSGLDDAGMDKVYQNMYLEGSINF